MTAAEFVHISEAILSQKRVVVPGNLASEAVNLGLFKAHLELCTAALMFMASEVQHIATIAERQRLAHVLLNEEPPA